MNLEKICEHCGSPYVASSKGRRFCSKVCSGKSSRNNITVYGRQRKCKRCRKAIGYGSGVGYCSYACSIIKPCNVRKVFSLKDAKSSSVVRKIVLETREHRCEICKLNTWLGVKILLEVDHINGDCSDHSDSNLRLLCNNCHAQTPTFRNKNFGKSKRDRRRYNKTRYTSSEVTILSI